MFSYFYIYISIYSKLIELCLVTFIHIYFMVITALGQNYQT